MFKQFRRGDASDPETFTATIAAVLSRYPRDVVMLVTDPRTGLALLYDWLPTAKQVADECDRRAREGNAGRVRDEIYRKQIEERKRLDAKSRPKCNPEKIGKPLRCNLLYRHDSPGYDRICERAQQEPRDAWRTSEGIWVPMAWHIGG